MTPVQGYSEMKDSGIEWVGEIPSHWKIIANKYVMHKEKRICEKWDNQDVLSLTMNGVIVRDILNPVGKMPTTFDGYQYVYNGELLMCLFDIDVTPRCVGRVFNDGVTSPAYSCFRLHNNADLGYFYYYYLMVDNTKELLHLAKNLRHSFTEEQLGQLKVPLPPLKEQSAIASYLDEKCSKIDEIIASAKASIEEYKKWKASIIYEAVTKGLDPNVEMKDSGIEWIGKIPKGWKISKIKTILENVSVKNHPDAEVLSLYRDLGVLPKNSRDDNHNVTSEDTAQYKFVEVGNLVINKMKAWQGSLAVSFYEGIVSPAYYVCRFRNNSMEKRYIHYLLRCKIYAQEFEKLSTGMRIGQWDLGIKDFMGIPVLFPPIEEQNKIAEYINTTCSSIDILTQEKESLIADLESYKKSLIYEAVTGKRKVC